MPFSYLIEKDDETYLVPGVNLRSVGTIRDAQEAYQARQAQGWFASDPINYNLLSPHTISTSKWLGSYLFLFYFIFCVF